MRRFVLALVLAFTLGSAVTAVADGLLNEIGGATFAACQGAPGYFGMNAERTVVALCTSDGVLHWIEAK